MIGYLQGLAHFYTLPSPDQPIIRYGPYKGELFRFFESIFPKCELLWWINIDDNGFWIKRYEYGPRRDRTIHFIATPNFLTENFRSEREVDTYLRLNNWFGRSTCKGGEILHVEVASRSQTGVPGSSAKLCGFGSLLLYLCFVSEGHDPPTKGYLKGYPLDTAPMNAMWETGNMPEIRQGLLAKYCRRIIYVRYRERYLNPGFSHNLDPNDIKDVSMEVGEISPLSTSRETKGNKAFIYASLAANYKYMVTYKSNPCQTGCCKFKTGKPEPNLDAEGNPIFKGGQPDATDNPNGKVFLLSDILSDFNKHDPRSLNVRPGTDHFTRNEPNFWQTKDFAEHHGHDWFFCSEGRYASLSADEKILEKVFGSLEKEA